MVWSNQILIVAIATLFYSGFSHANDLTYQEWKGIEAARMAPVPVQRPKKSPGFSRSFAKTIRTPLEQTVRDTLRPEAKFMEEEITKREPEVAKARTAYGDVLQTYEGSPEHKRWLEAKSKQPIVLEEYLAPHGLEGEYKDRRANLAREMWRLDAQKTALKKKLTSQSWLSRLFNPMEKERAELTAINLELQDIDNAFEYDIPMYEGITRMRQQDVRQKRLEQLKKDIAHPSDRFISNKPFIASYLHNRIGPAYGPYAQTHSENVTRWKIKIHHADKGGLGYLHENLDEELRQQVYHQSDAELEKAIAARNPNKELEAYEWFVPMWQEELARREYKRQKRAGINEPELLKEPWLTQAKDKAWQRVLKERTHR